MTEILLDGKQTAELLGCTEAALALWRKERRGPAYLRLGRLIRYREVDLLSWIESSRVEPARSAAEAAA